MEVKAKKLEQEIKDLKTGSKTTSIFKIVRKIQGPKKAGPEANALINPVTKKLATTKEDVLTAAITYCSSVLENNPPDVGYEKELELMNKLHEVRTTYGKAR